MAPHSTSWSVAWQCYGACREGGARSTVMIVTGCSCRCLSCVFWWRSAGFCCLQPVPARISHSDKVGEHIPMEEARWVLNVVYDAIAGQVGVSHTLMCCLSVQRSLGCTLACAGAKPSLASGGRATTVVGCVLAQLFSEGACMQPFVCGPMQQARQHCTGWQGRGIVVGAVCSTQCC